MILTLNYLRATTLIHSFSPRVQTLLDPAALLDPAPHPPPNHVQLFVRVLQGHLAGFLQLLAHDLEKVQGRHLNGAKQESLLGCGVLDVRPARFLGRDVVAVCKGSTGEGDSLCISASLPLSDTLCVCLCV